MSRATTFGGGVALAALALAGSPAFAQDGRVQKTVVPYIEAGQVLTADLNSGDVLTYTNVAVGVDAAIQTSRTQVQISYRYEHRFGWGEDLGDDSVHSGLAVASVQVARGLTLDAGAIAARGRSDFRGAAPGFLAGNVRNTSQIFSGYVGPTVSTRVGDFDVGGAYRFGYTKVEASQRSDTPATLPPLDTYDDSTSHLLTASAGFRPGSVLPIGLTLSGAWQREDVSQLDQRYDGKFARLDAIAPITPTLALVGGVGYEKIEISQRDPLLDATTRQPVVDDNGRFVTDPASPRRLAYDTDGLFWDAGVLWRPSPRTMVTARVGRRYDTMIYTGSLSYQVNRGSGIQVGVYDVVQSFGRSIASALDNLPTSFNTQPDPFGNQFGGCVFGTSGDAVGRCLSPTLGNITTANFRARGVDAVYVANLGAYRFGIGAGYLNQRYLVPVGGVSSPLSGVTDETYYAQVFAGRALGPRSSVVLNAYANWYDPGSAGAVDVFAAGANGIYSYQFGRVNAFASAGIFTSDAGDFGNDAQALGALGMRYSF